MKGKNEDTTFLPLTQSSGGLVQCLTTDQARYIYKKVEKDSLIM